MNYQRFKQIRRFTLLLSGLIFLFSVQLTSAHAALIELGGSFSFNQSNFGNGSLQWTRRWGASVGVYFLLLSELEFSVQDVLYRTKISSVEDTTFHDKIYSVNWVQSFLPRTSPLQPFVKAGLGQLNRDASGSYGGSSPPSSYDAVTGVLGAGFRIYVLRFISLKTEAVTYLTGGSIRTWRDNVAINAGVSLYF